MRLLVTVGLPGAGKSTWAAAQPGWTVLDLDSGVEALARASGASFAEAWLAADRRGLEDQLVDRVSALLAAGERVIVDRCHVRRSDRRPWLLLGRARGVGVGLVVVRSSADERAARLAARAGATGKVVPPEVVAHRASRWEEPAPDEGFATILTVGGDLAG